ncbi:MAG: TPM domain-containing protein [Bacteroidetes bacterium]|nr:TPM domain-containing protein [Bacteroidota bacterium]
MSHAGTFFSKADDERIVAAIKASEQKTSGEIRVHLEDRCDGGDPYLRAVALFEKLGMTKTEARNGVLFYLAVKDHKFAVLGDQGIDAAVPDDFWDQIKTRMESDFRQGRFADGLCTAVEEAGRLLRQHFPHSGARDRNELSDELSIGQ